MWAQNGFTENEIRESSDSDPDVFLSQPCSVNHDGRHIATIEVDLNIDEVFTMMFTNSRFVSEMNEQRNITEFDVSSDWNRDPRTNLKTRQITFTLPLSGLGPKESLVTETHTMTSCSEPGVRYSVDIVAENTGVPYADSFSVLFHNCLERITDKSTRINLFGDVKFKKPVWGMVRAMIEKPTLSNLETVADLLEKTLKRYAKLSSRYNGAEDKKDIIRKSRTNNKSADQRPRRNKTPSDTSRFKLSGLISMLALLIAINCQLYLILKQEDAKSCILNMGWEESFSEDDYESMDDYMELMNEFTEKQKQQLTTIKQMLYREIETLKKTEQAITTIIEKLQSPPKPRKKQIRKLINF